METACNFYYQQLYNCFLCLCLQDHWGFFPRQNLSRLLQETPFCWSVKLLGSPCPWCTGSETRMTCSWARPTRGWPSCPPELYRSAGFSTGTAGSTDAWRKTQPVQELEMMQKSEFWQVRTGPFYAASLSCLVVSFGSLKEQSLLLGQLGWFIPLSFQLLLQASKFFFTWKSLETFRSSWMQRWGVDTLGKYSCCLTSSTKFRYVWSWSLLHGQWREASTSHLTVLVRALELFSLSTLRKSSSHSINWKGNLLGLAAEFTYSKLGCLDTSVPDVICQVAQTAVWALTQFNCDR